MLGGRAGLFFASHVMALLHAISGAFAKHHRALKPADFFPHLEEYFKPPPPSKQNQFVAVLAAMPGFKPEYLERLRRG
jgi:hypothetical protein